MMHHHARAAGMLGYQQQRRHVVLIPFEADQLLDVSIPPPYIVDEQAGHGRDRESQQLSHTPTQALRGHEEDSRVILQPVSSEVVPSGLPKPLDYLIGTVEEHLFDVLRDASDLIVSAGLSLDFGQLLR